MKSAFEAERLQLKYLGLNFTMLLPCVHLQCAGRVLCRKGRPALPLYSHAAAALCVPCSVAGSAKGSSVVSATTSGISMNNVSAILASQGTKTEALQNVAEVRVLGCC